MSSLDRPVDEGAPLAPCGLARAGDYAMYAEAFERSVVVLATGHECWIVPEGDRHTLLVTPEALPSIAQQLGRYERESEHWPPQPLADPAAHRVPDILTPLLWAIVVLTIFRMQRGHPAWVSMGNLDPTAMFGRGEWWRAATALFLHGDAAHVIANVLGGLLAFPAVLSALGTWRGWLAIAVAAGLGNLAVAALNATVDYRSLGASTAIFAAIGVLTGRAVRRVLAHRAQPHRWRAIFVPAAAGCTVLALYGAGVGNVDVPAHACGFLAGTAIGLLGGAIRASGARH